MTAKKSAAEFVQLSKEEHTALLEELALVKEVAASFKDEIKSWKEQSDFNDKLLTQERTINTKLKEQLKDSQAEAEYFRSQYIGALEHISKQDGYIVALQQTANVEARKVNGNSPLPFPNLTVGKPEYVPHAVNYAPYEYKGRISSNIQQDTAFEASFNSRSRWG